MKILYIITKSNWGGAQRHVYDLAVFFKKQGHEVVVALGGEGILNDRLLTDGIRTISIRSMKRDVSILEDSASFGAISGIIRRERPDVLHLHSSKAAGLGALAGRLWRIKKIIFTIHGSALNEDRPLHQKAFIAFFTWLTMIISTHIITISEKEAGQIKLFPFVANKVRMIYLGIAPPIFMSKSSTEIFIKSKISALDKKSIVVGTIAELHPNKGLIYAINAMEKLVIRFPSTILLIIGEGDEKTNIESLIKEKKLEKNVILAGYVENAAQYLKGFSIFLLPSVKEGLPYTIIEAGFAGLPVIATTVGGIPEIVDDMKSGILIQSKKSDEIFHALEFFLKHKNVQKEYGRNLKAKVAATFSLDKMLASTEKIYEETPKSR